MRQFIILENDCFLKEFLLLDRDENLPGIDMESFLWHIFNNAKDYQNTDRVIHDLLETDLIFSDSSLELDQKEKISYLIKHILFRTNLVFMQNYPDWTILECEYVSRVIDGVVLRIEYIVNNGDSYGNSAL